MTILSIDYGRKNLGLAISFDGKVAHQFEVLSYSNLSNLIQRLNETIRENRVEKIVLGLPLSERGEVGKSAREVKKFGLALQTKLRRPVFYQNETLSSFQAQKRMRKVSLSHPRRLLKEHAFAAQIILQDFLGSKC